MSDSAIAVTAGVGTNVDTDLIGGDHVQIVKPAWGALGTRNLVDTPTPLPVEIVPKANGGSSIYYLSSAATTNGNNVKASTGKLYSIIATNTNASPRYLRFYNTAGAPTVGTTAVYFAMALPGGGGVSFDVSGGVAFSTGIAISLTGAAIDTDTTAIAVNEVKLTLIYQ